MKKILKIKFENIIALLGFILFTYGMIEHQLSGFSLNKLMIEMLFYYPICLVVKYSLKEVRYNLIRMI